MAGLNEKSSLKRKLYDGKLLSKHIFQPADYNNSCWRCWNICCNISFCIWKSRPGFMSSLPHLVPHRVPHQVPHRVLRSVLHHIKSAIGNSVEDLMATVVENNYDDLVAQAASFNETTRSTDSIAILNIFDSALSDYSGWFWNSYWKASFWLANESNALLIGIHKPVKAIGLTRSLRNNIFFFTNFLYAYEQLLDTINFAIFAYR